MKLPIFINDTNYVEIYLHKKKEEIYDTNLEDDVFKKILKAFKKSHHKSFKKDNIKTYNSTLEYLSEDSENVFEYTIDSCHLFAQNKRDFIQITFHKNQKSTYIFPSNDEIHDIISNTRITYKLNNLVYLNFQISENYIGKVTKSIYFNINHSKNFDESVVKKTIDEALSLF
jgi:hypothetical protein